MFFQIVFYLKGAYETEKWGVDKPPSVLTFITILWKTGETV